MYAHTPTPRPPTARELIARRARVLMYQALFAIGGFLAIVFVLPFIPTRLDMVAYSPAGAGVGDAVTALVAGLWPWLLAPIATFLLGAAVTSAITGELIWPLNWVAALALRNVDFEAPCVRHDGYDVHDDVFTPDDCGPGCTDEDPAGWQR